MRTLLTPVATLQPLVSGHAREMFAVLSDPAIYEFENEPPASEAWLAERYARLERRTSPEGDQQWLNWVVRLPDGALAGYVQATVLRSGTALVAYELASRYWRRGLGRAALTAMLEELRNEYGVRAFAAVLKAANFRSEGLLVKLGFVRDTPAQDSEIRVAADELFMTRAASTPDA